MKHYSAVTAAIAVLILSSPCSAEPKKEQWFGKDSATGFYGEEKPKTLPQPGATPTEQQLKNQLLRWKTEAEEKGKAALKEEKVVEMSPAGEELQVEQAPPSKLFPDD